MYSPYQADCLQLCYEGGTACTMQSEFRSFADELYMYHAVQRTVSSRGLLTDDTTALLSCIGSKKHAQICIYMIASYMHGLERLHVSYMLQTLNQRFPPPASLYLCGERHHSDWHICMPYTY